MTSLEWCFSHRNLVILIQISQEPMHDMLLFLVDVWITYTIIYLYTYLCELGNVCLYDGTWIVSKIEMAKTQLKLQSIHHTKKMIKHFI